ncbi:hypothetical protein MNBD_NITROSPINAE05-1073 [hydrothermal vent metagenome]|uniref:Uncharacterized protein n=1 Tax=hydrothermal vent metagenome TaxID=652676 RepID=A0A3B1CKJ3_9ZZZZ
MRKFLLATMLTLMGFAAMVTTTQAQILTAPVTTDSARVAISPYAQTVPNDSYTFMGFSHPSLDTSLTQVGIVLEVLGMTTVPNDAAGRSVTFTVDAGETHRVFIVDAGNSITATADAFNNSRTHIITTDNSAQFGTVRIVGINEDPTGSTTVGSTLKYDNVSQLNMWGVVFIPSSGTGFAMEFIGDAHDSTIGNITSGVVGADGNTTTGAGRGIN